MEENNIKQGLKGLELISQTVGKYPDMVQGGGGNTSAKLNDEIMAIKASGYKLSQVTQKDGFARVNYSDILDFHNNLDLSQDKDFSGESKQIIQDSVVDEGGNELKPSIETGFHSFLKKYVIHTHSVYANILCCAQEGEKLVKEIFADEDHEPLWLPYTHPGFHLTRVVSDAVDKFQKKYNGKPKIIFLENHGLVVTDDDARDSIELNTEVNNKIKAFFDINRDYPQTRLEEDEEVFISHNNYLKDFFKNNSEIDEDYFKQFLYPDQIVYMGGDISVNGKDAKINIDTDTGDIEYRAGANEAQTIDEIMTAVLFIIEEIENNNLTLKTMEPKYIDLIKHMEDEDYRKKIMKDM